MRSGKPLFLEIEGKSIGLVAGERLQIRLHAFGWKAQQGKVWLVIFDERGARCFRDIRDQVAIAENHAIFTFAWEIPEEMPSGRYAVEVMLFGAEENIRSIATDDFEVVALETKSPGRFPALPRDRTIPGLYDFKPVSREQLVAYFQLGHRLCEQDRNADGSWGKGYNSPELGFHPLYRVVGNIVLGYLLGYRWFGQEIYRERALDGLQYLLDEQESNGAYRWWCTPEGILDDWDCFFPTGWAGLALVEGYRTFGDARYLKAVRQAADWTLNCPVTGNNNYDAFVLWFLGPLYEITGEEVYLESAVRRTQEGIFFSQCSHGGYPGHNSHIGYQLIIMQGLASLYRALPEGHPFKPVLWRRLVLATNNAIYKQSDSGAMFGGWEYDPGFTIDVYSRPVGQLSPEPFPYAFYLAWREVGFDRRVFDGLCKRAVADSQQLATMSPEEQANRCKLLEPVTLLIWYDELAGKRSE